jgi:hypothetical protein
LMAVGIPGHASIAAASRGLDKGLSFYSVIWRGSSRVDKVSFFHAIR